MSAHTPSSDDIAEAERFTVLVSELIDAAVMGASGPSRCCAALRIALSSIELASEADAVEMGLSFANEFLAETPTAVIRGLAEEALESRVAPLLLPAERLGPIAEAALRALQALLPSNPIDALTALHVAEKLVLQEISAQKTEAELSEFLAVFVALKRGLALVQLDNPGLFMAPRPLGRGGDA